MGETRRRYSGRPTLTEVATLAGVSPSTVSRVVRGSTPARPSTEQAVWRAIDEMGYVPNLAARSLVTSRTDSIGLVIFEDDTRLFSDPFFAGMIRSIGNALAETPLRLVLVMAPSSSDRAWLQRYVSSRHVDGVMLMALHGSDPLPAQLERAGTPVAVMGRPVTGTVRRYVDADNLGGARAAVEYLLSTGRSTVATISGPRNLRHAEDRLAGYSAALRAARVRRRPALIESGDFGRESGHRAMQALLARAPGIDGVFAASDDMAVGAIKALQEAGRRVPDDVAVVGFDDDPIARDVDPPLTTVAQPVEAMGREFVRIMIEALADPRAEHHVVLPTSLVIRQSS